MFLVKLGRFAMYLVAALCSFAAMIAAQNAALEFAYGVVPGKKSTDGPVLVALAYLLCPPLAAISYSWARRQPWSGAFLSLILSTAVGPILMLLASFANAWLARLPPGI